MQNETKKRQTKQGKMKLKKGNNNIDLHQGKKV